jgi:hypothetical protein
MVIVIECGRSRAEQKPLRGHIHQKRIRHFRFRRIRIRRLRLRQWRRWRKR